MNRATRIVCLVLMTLVVTACATGSMLLTGRKRPAIDPSQVIVYAVAPAHYEVIGIIKSRSMSGWNDQDKANNALTDMKERAAAVGANGILLQNIGDQTNIVAGVSQSFSGTGSGTFFAVPSKQATLTGEAIYVPNNNGHER